MENNIFILFDCESLFSLTSSNINYVHIPRKKEKQEILHKKKLNQIKFSIYGNDDYVMR